ncbi:MAG: thioesterase family protein [Aeromicrobium sp.]|uniref:thioesterase family protein n=1 Tax=Aeromicrobium sp. TaxID=1871063 RepID=UPI0039E376A7
MDYELDRATASSPVSPGVRALDVNSDWNTPAGTANGGYLLAILLRAALEESAKPDPLSVAVTYLATTRPGPATITVTPLREGRLVSSYTVALHQGERAIAHATISLHDAAAAPASDLREPLPGDAVGTPETGVDPLADWPVGTIPIADRYTTRHVGTPGWMAGDPSGLPEAAFWIRPADGRPIDSLAAGAIVDAYPPVVAELGHIASSTIQLTVHFWRHCSTDWALMEVVTSQVIDGFHDEDVHLWDRDLNLVATSRQIAVLS